jgi:hypothetical protein
LTLVVLSSAFSAFSAVNPLLLELLMTPRLSRRDLFKLSAAGVVGSSVSGWLETLAHAAAAHPMRKRACILLWMNGGPSQMDTFDLKPGHKNGGPFKEIDTSAPGLRISEHLPKIAAFGHRMAVIRSMQTKEADHGRATFLMRTGYMPTGPIQYPSIGSLVCKELGHDDSSLPNFVSIAPFRPFSPAAYGPGFLGPRYAPLVVGDGVQFFRPAPGSDYARALKVQDVDLPADVEKAHADVRLDLLREMEDEFIANHPGVAPLSHRTAYERAIRLMKTAASKAFNLEEEKPTLRDAYGRNLFGQGCLLARRLVEQGVPFIEVTLSNAPGAGGIGWDTHQNNFEAVKSLSSVLDPAWATLMSDLQDRGLLDTTLIVWMGEFGRTPQMARPNGRDHWPNSWSTVLAGGGIKGGQAVGKTSADGMEVKDRPVSVPDFLATVCRALGIDYQKQNISNVNRPIRIADKSARPITEVLA